MIFEAPNYEQFGVPVHKFNSIDLALEHLGPDGLYSINIGHENLPLDLLINNFPQENANQLQEIIVAFAGAIPNRVNKTGPFFGFAGVCQQLRKDVPFIAISDPSLYLDKNLNLAWYAGNQFIPDLIEKIAYLLQGIVQRYKCRLILLGASGGGFAALRTLEVIDCSNVSVFTWNPQIKLSKYELWAVRRYISTCFKVESSKIKNEKDIEETLKSLKIKNETRLVPKKGKITYFINDDDSSHIFEHMNHYFLNSDIERINSNNFLTNNCLIHIGSFGKGHAGPTKPVVLETINDTVANKHFLKYKCIQTRPAKSPLWIDLQTSVQLEQQQPLHFILNNLLICSYQPHGYSSFIATWKIYDDIGNETTTPLNRSQTIAINLEKFDNATTLNCLLEVNGIFNKKKTYKYKLKLEQIPILPIA
ncbi:hypothetical protein KOE80_02360 [Alcaligenes sp. 13f]|uniref:hypothetical protein n=1 Tax=Alcaligenes sp. 13f TaxID=2841924 RepID=UPI001CF64311|nr:hypothetical protein [Alcaligenes sp. 13f]MCB4321047.1 hypothetical protein [Alcaligenes sp. 13f]